MTRGADCDQILFRIVPRMAAELFVMDFQVRHAAARLTPPAIATQYPQPKILVRHRVQPQAR